jgi:tetratricopeptide (TPR) repeat protein
MDASGAEMITYQPETPSSRTLPDSATEPPPPEEIVSTDELYLIGLHLQQYRYATRSPEVYWSEGLKRDPNDFRLNNALGLTYLRKGQFGEAEGHFARAIRRLTSRNPNPYDGESYYNLGLACRYQGKSADAYDAFHKSVWNYAWQSAGYYALASISAERGNLCLALEQVERSLLTNIANLNARALKAALLRRTSRKTEALTVIGETLAMDLLSFRMMAERFLLTREDQDLCAFVTALEGDIQTLLDVACELAWSGLRDDAYVLLQACGRSAQWEHPMFWFTLSWLAASLGHELEAVQYASKGEAASARYCFPARLEEMIVLEAAIQRNPSSAKAYYYLGNLYYDKRRYDDAIRCWRRSVELDGRFSIPFRNLGIAEFNILHNAEAAGHMYECAFVASSEDARVLYEWDQLKKRAGLATPAERLRSLEQHRDHVARRDDLTIEYITLLNQRKQWQSALELLSARRFSPWEGGEGLVSGKYVYARRALGIAALCEGKPSDSLWQFEAARHYPESLGEGKHLLTLERDLDYFSGLAAEELGDANLAKLHWSAAAAPLGTFGVHSYFQALGLKALGNLRSARALLSSLLEFAARMTDVEPKIDYFATSLPNLLLFDDDLRQRNQIESLLLTALASHGLEQVETAVRLLQEVLDIDLNNLFAADMLDWFKRRTGAVQERTNERAVR